MFFAPQPQPGTASKALLRQVTLMFLGFCLDYACLIMYVYIHMVTIFIHAYSCKYIHWHQRAFLSVSLFSSRDLSELPTLIAERESRSFLRRLAATAKGSSPACRALCIPVSWTSTFRMRTGRLGFLKGCGWKGWLECRQTHISHLAFP